jgi:hypothetical protein
MSVAEIIAGLGYKTAHEVSNEEYMKIREEVTMVFKRKGDYC